MTNTEQFTSADQVFRQLKARLRHVLPEGLVPDFELRLKAELVAQIETLKREKNAVILGHNYMEPVLFHTVPDYRGDSLELSKKAAETQADIIVFCGVHFMAETAKILNPTKKVLIPSREAGCSLAEGIQPADLRWLRVHYPHLPIITYINSSAAVKAQSDIIATSGNVKQVVNWARHHYNTSSVIFLPDKYMAKNVATELFMDTYFPDKKSEPRSEIEVTQKPTVIGWDAACYVHEQYTPEHIHSIRSDYPDAVVLAHPECPPDVVSASDFSGSTSAMTKYIQEHGPSKHIALLTECSMADNLVAQNPKLNDHLIRMCNLRCRYMHTITLEQTLAALKNEQFEIIIPEEIRRPAEIAVRRMFEVPV
jgi:quinolinate synthase